MRKPPALPRWGISEIRQCHPKISELATATDSMMQMARLRHVKTVKTRLRAFWITGLGPAALSLLVLFGGTVQRSHRLCFFGVRQDANPKHIYRIAWYVLIIWCNYKISSSDVRQAHTKYAMIINDTCSECKISEWFPRARLKSKS